jgi:hypothetical protein
MLAQHIARRVGTPPDHKWHKRNGYALAAATAKPAPVRLMQQLAQGRHRNGGARP